MPELPEVETVANGVHARVAGLRIDRVWTSGKPQTFKSPESELIEVLTGARIQRVRRVGKTVVCDLRSPRSSGRDSEADAQDGKPDDRTSHDAQLLVHLGMTGRLLVSAPEVPWPPHTHAVLSLSDGRELRFVDPRRFGRLSVVREQSGYQGPGAEPTTISPEAFARLFKGRKLAIKAALLNQSILHGVGNIYADEALFRAGIRPRRAAGRLSLAGAPPFARGVATGARPGHRAGRVFGVRLRRRRRDARLLSSWSTRFTAAPGKPATTAPRRLKKIVVGGRTTVYCPKCQR